MNRKAGPATVACARALACISILRIWTIYISCCSGSKHADWSVCYFIAAISSLLFHRCYFIAVISSLLFHRCYFIAVISSLLFHRCYFIAAVLPLQGKKLSEVWDVHHGRGAMSAAMWTPMQCRTLLMRNSSRESTVERKLTCWDSCCFCLLVTGS